MTDRVKQFGTERLTGVITALTVSGVSVFISLDRDVVDWQAVASQLCLLGVYLTLYIATTADDIDGKQLPAMLLIFMQLVVVYALFFTVPFNFYAILLGIWASNLLHYMTLRHAVFVTPLLMFGYYAIFTWYWQEDYMVYSALLYWMLSLFTLVMVNSWVQENEAKEASQQLNRELLAAQTLLKEATKQSERVRIARNIHDLVGHHLTALTINLQVAMRKSEGEAQQQVEKSYAIAKLLLSDVREAVSEIREKSNIELRESLHALIDALPRLEVQLELDADLHITNVELADVIIKSVQESLTNSLKHSKSDTFTIKIYQANQTLMVSMQDNGGGVLELEPGNGLRGIEERIAMLKGTVKFHSDAKGFTTSICIPELT